MIESNTIEGFFNIPPGAIIPGTLGKFSIYLKSGEGKPVLYSKKGETVPPDVFKRLSSRGVKNLHVSTEDEVKFEKYVDDHLQEILKSEDIDPPTKVKYFEQCTLKRVQESFNSGKMHHVKDSDIHHLQKLITSTMSYISSDEAVKELGKLIGHDYETHSHSMKVFWMSLLLIDDCIELHPDRDKILQSFDKYKINLGVASMLHDIGKTLIPLSLLNKEGKLNEAEMLAMKNHSVNSVALLLESKTNLMVRKAILHHHEDYSGEGYPFALKEDEIPFEARLIRIVDVFEAITSKRPYKPSKSPSNALEIMSGQRLQRNGPPLSEEEDPRDKEGMLRCFDREMLKRFILLLRKRKII
jgi:response regulator RpfG family c-di-GMP phosphodiesterase